MSGYATQRNTLDLGSQDDRIRSLPAVQRFSDADARAGAAAIASARCSLSGTLSAQGDPLGERREAQAGRGDLRPRRGRAPRCRCDALPIGGNA